MLSFALICYVINSENSQIAICFVLPIRQFPWFSLHSFRLHVMSSLGLLWLLWLWFYNTQLERLWWTGNTHTRINLQSEATLQPDFIYKPLAPKSGVFLELLGTSLSALPSLLDITAVMFAQTICFPAIGSPNFP